MGLISFFTKGDKSKLAILNEAGEDESEFEIDFLESESHEWNNEITQFPVEGGGNISDHIIKNPKSVKIVGLASDSPIDVFDILTGSGVLGQLFSTPNTQKAVKFFEDLRDLQKIVKVTTKLYTYPSMGCTSVTINRGKTSGNSIKYDIVFTEIRIVSTKTEKLTKIPGAKDKTSSLKKRGSSSASKDLGKKSNVEATPEAANKSGSILSNWTGFGT